MLNGKYTQWDDNVNHPTFYKIENLPTCDKGILTINEETLVKLPVPSDIKNDGNEMDSYPQDTYFDFSCGRAESCPWLHGSVFVNGFNVGRYHTAGPLQTLYIPGPLLQQGENEVKP